MKKWQVLAPDGRVLFGGSRQECHAYMKRARAKGTEDYLRIVSDMGRGKRGEKP